MTTMDWLRRSVDKITLIAEGDRSVNLVAMKKKVYEENLEWPLFADLEIKEVQEVLGSNYHFAARLRREAKREWKSVMEKSGGFKCKRCGEAFPYEDILSRHMRVVHRHRVPAAPSPAVVKEEGPKGELGMKREALTPDCIDLENEGVNVLPDNEVNGLLDKEVNGLPVEPPLLRPTQPENEVNGLLDQEVNGLAVEPPLLRPTQPDKEQLSLEKGEKQSLVPQEKGEEQLLPEEPQPGNGEVGGKLVVEEVVGRALSSALKQPPNPSASGRGAGTCLACGKSISRKDGVKDHMQRMHGQDGVRCGSHGTQFASVEGMDSHLKAEHGRTQCICIHCRKALGNLGDLTSHIRTDHANPVFGCQLCDYRCAGRLQLASHLEKKHGGECYYCGLCQETFVRRDHVVKHMKTAHMGSGFRVLACHNCNMFSQDGDRLANHLTESHVSKVFTCDACGGDGFGSADLRKHMKSNHGGLVLGEGKTSLWKARADHKEDEEEDDSNGGNDGEDQTQGDSKVPGGGRLQLSMSKVQKGEGELQHEEVDKVALEKLRRVSCDQCSFSTAARSRLNQQFSLSRHKRQQHSSGRATSLPLGSALGSVAQGVSTKTIRAALWVERSAEDPGNVFYHNLSTNATSRERPSGIGVQVVSESEYQERQSLAFKRKGGEDNSVPKKRSR